MKNNVVKYLASAALAVGMVSAVQATSINGSIGFTGRYSQVGGTLGNLATATSMTVINTVANPITVNVATGDLAGSGEPITFATPIGVNGNPPPLIGVELWSVTKGLTTYSLLVTSETQTFTSLTQLNLSGAGILQDGNPANSTAGVWQLSFGVSGNSFTWQSTSTGGRPAIRVQPMSFLSFSNLTVGDVYQLQRSVAWYWSNQPVSFTATNALYTQMVAGVAGSGDYRLALSPVPSQAFATAVVDQGIVVQPTVTSGGSGYVTTPAVTIVADGGGSNATAVAQISGGVVTNITITDTGIGYTNTPEVEIDPPPAVAVSPTVLPMMRLDSASLVPDHNYQIQFKSGLGGAWANWNGGLFNPTTVTNSQYLFITNSVSFFRLQSVP